MIAVLFNPTWCGGLRLLSSCTQQRAVIAVFCVVLLFVHLFCLYYFFLIIIIPEVKV